MQVIFEKKSIKICYLSVFICAKSLLLEILLAEFYSRNVHNEIFLILLCAAIFYFIKLSKGHKIKNEINSLIKSFVEEIPFSLKGKE